MRPDASASLDDAANAGGAAMPGEPHAVAPSSARKPRRASAAQRGGDTNVGNVLRSVYQSAVQEDIPAEMLDLLSKLD